MSKNTPPKAFATAKAFGIIEENHLGRPPHGKARRRQPAAKAMVIDIDMLVPKDHLLRKIEKVMDYDWLYERLNPLYNDKVGRPGTDPVVLIKMVLIQHLFGIPSLRRRGGNAM